MKKIITLVLALVMVFALAAPAMALTDAPLGTAPNTITDRFTMSIQAAGGMPAYGTTLSIPTVVANKAWVANELVYFAITITAIAGYSSVATNPQLTTPAYNDVVLHVTGNGVDIASYRSSVIALTNGSGSWAALGTYAQTHTAAITNGFAGDVSNFVATGTTNVQYVICGIGKVTGTVAAASITATLGIASMTIGSAYQTLKIGTNVAHVVKVSATEYEVSVFTAPGGTQVCKVKFTMNPVTNKCVKIDYFVGASSTGEAVTYGDGMGSTSDYYNPTYDFLFAGAMDAAKKANFVAVMNFFGFDYSKINTNAVLEGHFRSKIHAPNLSVKLDVPLYGSPITTPINIPKTGDAASWLGFALIGVALVAAIAVAYKKVRA